MTKLKFDTAALDDILIQLGDFGSYQIFIFGLVCIAIIFNSAIVVDYVFRAMNLDYRCDIPYCNAAGNTEYEPPWLVHAVPYKENMPEKCLMYKYINSFSEHINDSCTSSDFNQTMILRCKSFVYESSEKTILQEYNLHCDENLWKITMVGTINIIGQFFGIFLSGLISDWYGRRTVLVWGMVLCALCGLIRILMPNYWWFLVLEFFNSAFGSGTYMCGFVLGVELVAPKNRVLAGVIISCCFAIGEIFAAGCAWIVKSWKVLSVIIYAPSLLLISYFWLIPESVRWNLSKGRTEDAKATLKLAAKINNIQISDIALEKLLVYDSVEDSYRGGDYPLKKVLKSRRLMLRTINCCFCWITTAFLFYGLSLNSVTLAAGNSYLDFIMTALVELPTYIICNYSLRIFGRRKSLSASFLITGIACISFIFISSDSHAGRLSLYLAGKFGATAAFTSIYVLTSEMFPTSIRHTLMAICSTFGRIGSIIAPQVPLLAQLWPSLPLTSFAIMAFFAGLLSLLFPETLNIKLPDTIEEAERISKLPRIILE